MDWKVALGTLRILSASSFFRPYSWNSQSHKPPEWYIPHSFSIDNRETNPLHSRTVAM